MTLRRFEHDIEADWTMFLTCNFACKYCFFTPEQLGSKLVPVADNAAWQAAFDNTGLRWLILLTGGEPTVYPGFVDLCQRLTQQHFIGINTNLSLPVMMDFASQVDPDRVAMVNAAFHPAERLERSGDGKFITHYNALRSRGFVLMASVVALPEVLADFDAIQARLLQDDIVLVPKVIRGAYQGRLYPMAYTDQERASFLAAHQRAMAHYAHLLASLAEPMMLNLFGDDRYLHQMPDHRGAECGTGHSFVQIGPEGMVHCCPREYMGNLLDGTFVADQQDRVCHSSYCHYWCERHVRPTRATGTRHIPVMQA